MLVPHELEQLIAILPDVPRWIETRSLLLSGSGMLSIAQDGDGAVVMDTQFPSASVIGRADTELLRDVLADVPDDFELIVQMDALAQARVALPGWAAAVAIVHSPRVPYRSGDRPGPGVVVSAPAEKRLLEHLPPPVRTYGASADAVAVRTLKGKAVAICAAGDVTETLWDVGIDTLTAHRRRGYATACFHALADWMVARGKQPVWAAYEDYPPSLRLAERLKFQPVDRLAVLSPPPVTRADPSNKAGRLPPSSGRRPRAQGRG